jgi:hypothetical protein
MKSQRQLRPKKVDYFLWKVIAEESAVRCCTSTTLDWKTVETRSKHEGFSFLTITLANFGKDFERCLDQGYVDPSAFHGFHRKQGLPRFLGGFLDQVFDRGSGVLLDDPNVEAIKEIRQLTLMYSKILLPCSDAREQAAYDGYIKSEQDVGIEDNRRSPIDLEAFRRVSHMLFGKMFLSIDREVYFNYTIPKHGPGATADRLRANAKYRQHTWPSRLEKWFPMELYLLPSPRYYEELAEIDILEPETEIPVRIISVPKTLKTPRIIGIEPTAMQYAQQSLLPLILEGIKDFHLGSFLGFDDQTPNQRMAKEGSRTGKLATLDLSEASDRVSNQLVRNLALSEGPTLQAIQACRSTKADVPGHGVIPLDKFASMGSALTFPIEAMVFLTIILIGIERSLSTQMTPELLSELRGSVRVYGDDILVPVEHVRSVIDTLELFGARVNRNKSFWNGKFRESCGREYYDGHDVSIVKVRRVLPSSRKHGLEVISMVAFRNLLYWEGYWSTCQWIDCKIRAMLKHFPVVEQTTQALGRESVLPYRAERVNAELHRPEIRAYVVRSRLPKSDLEGPGALLKWMLFKQGLRRDERSAHLPEPVLDQHHLTRAGRADAVDIKLGWTTPY